MCGIVYVRDADPSPSILVFYIPIARKVTEMTLERHSVICETCSFFLCVERTAQNVRRIKLSETNQEIIASAK